MPKVKVFTMVKQMDAIIFVIVLLLLVITIIGLSGCTSQGAPEGNGFGPGGQGDWGGGPGMNANLTQEEREQMMQERMQAGIAACAGMQEGDACEMQGFRNESINGTCLSMNGTLSCGFGGAQRREPPN